jgi:hypothetical protein
VVLYNHREEHKTNTDRKDKIMKKTIKTEELMNAIEKIKAQARGQYESHENQQMQNHGYGMEDAMTMLEILLKI